MDESDRSTNELTDVEKTMADQVCTAIDAMEERQVRQILKGVARIHPNIVQSVMNGSSSSLSQGGEDDVHSMDTQVASNCTKTTTSATLATATQNGGTRVVMIPAGASAPVASTPINAANEPVPQIKSSSAQPRNPLMTPGILSRTVSGGDFAISPVNRRPGIRGRVRDTIPIPGSSTPETRGRQSVGDVVPPSNGSSRVAVDMSSTPKAKAYHRNDPGSADDRLGIPSPAEDRNLFLSRKVSRGEEDKDETEARPPGIADGGASKPIPARRMSTASTNSTTARHLSPKRRSSSSSVGSASSLPLTLSPRQSVSISNLRSLSPRPTVPISNLRSSPPPPSLAGPLSPVAPDIGSAGACFLVYNGDEAKLMLHYSHHMVGNAVGMWKPTPPYQIQNFKFTQNFGRADLIGNCASGVSGRKNYYSGWCQFVRQARELYGQVTIFPARSGLPIDMFVYRSKASPQSQRIPPNVPYPTADIEAVACLPRNYDLYPNMNIDQVKWMDEANAAGFASSFGPASSHSPAKVMRVPQPPPQMPTPVSTKPKLSPKVEGACYLVYEPTSSGKLLVQYSRMIDIPAAVGKWTPGPKHRIQGFKFSQRSSELIGNCAAGMAGRKNYYSGWCQFVRAARQMNGHVTVLEHQQHHGIISSSSPSPSNGLPVDVYIYLGGGQLPQTIQLQPEKPMDVSQSLAVACLPKHARFYCDLKVDLNKWLTEAATVGAASRF